MIPIVADKLTIAIFEALPNLYNKVNPTTITNSVGCFFKLPIK